MIYNVDYRNNWKNMKLKVAILQKYSLLHERKILMNVLVVFCHPSKNSFTNTVKEAFINGLEAAGHSYEVSDLYADKFNPIMSEEEYIREGFISLTNLSRMMY